MFLSFFGTIGNILLFLIVLSVVICLHELGHLYFAKKAGILCHEFSFGMGPKLWGKKVGETTYAIRAIPFGGFVSMSGEEVESEVVKIGQKIRIGLNANGEIEKIIVNYQNPKFQDLEEIIVESIDLQGKDHAPLYINDYTVKRDAFYVFDKNQIQIAPYERNFTNKTKMQRFLTAFGGPLMNFVLAIVIYLFLAFMLGVPNPSSTVVGSVSSGMPAYEVLLPGDEITKINGVDVSAWTSSKDITTVNTELAKYQTSTTFVFTVIRDGEEIDLPAIQPQYLFYGLGFVADVSASDLTILSPLYQKSELLKGDIIQSINGQTFTSWNDLITYALSYTEGSTDESPTVIVVLRDTELLTFSYVSYSTDVLDAMGYEIFYSRIGISGSNHFSLIGGIENAFLAFGNAATSIYKTLGLLFTSSQVGLSDMGGFLGIYSMTANAASQGFYTLMSFVAFLSVNLGIINLLPIPALDGGRIVFIGYEAITKRKPNKKVENWLHTIVFFLLIALMIYVTYNDILRFIHAN
jgi:regulator of sigma E protease